MSSAEDNSTFDSQAERLTASCVARGSPVAQVVKEVGSGVHDAHPKLLARLADVGIGLIVVEQKDRLTRFGLRSLDTLLKTHGRALEPLNHCSGSAMPRSIARRTSSPM